MNKKFNSSITLLCTVVIFLSILMLFSCAVKQTDIATPSQEPLEETVEEESAYLEEERLQSEKLMRLKDENEADMAYIKGVGVKEKEAPKTWKRSQVTANTSRLLIGENDELPMKAMQANVRIDGSRARVIIDTFYFNDRNRQYEGTFKLRLPEGANPYFFAFGEMVMTADIDFNSPIFMSAENSMKQGVTPEEIMSARKDSWTAPKEARMVPREKAAHAYTETVRRKVDPALMEWSGAGIFSCRVFPLMPKKLHRIVIGYEVDLTPIGDDFEYRFDLPEKVSQSVVDLIITEMSKTKVNVVPAVDLSRIPGSDTSKSPSKLHHRFKNPDTNFIKVRIENPGIILLTGIDMKAGEYFATGFRLKLPISPITAGPDSAVFLVDVSLSANPDKFNIYLKLLSAILQNNRNTIQNFAVLFFNVESFWWHEGFTKNTKEAVASLMTYANTLALEGATDIGAALQKASQPDWISVDNTKGGWDLFLLSDGAITWGEEELFALTRILDQGQINALFSYQTGLTGTDLNVLNHLARESGGAVFSVVGESEIAVASKAHCSRPWNIISLELQGCKDLLIAGRPRAFFPGQFLRLAGRGTPALNSQLLIHVEQDGIRKTIKYQFNKRISSPLAKRAYGLIAVGQLETFGLVSEEMSKAYATHFGVTGKTDSLLMLETEEDYKRFNIRPEEDAFVVTNTMVSDYISSLIIKTGNTLGDPKIKFASWLKKLENQPGFTFETPASLKLVMEKIPARAYNVFKKPIVAAHRLRMGIPEEIQHQLTLKKPEYDTFYEEAERRLNKFGQGDYLRALSSLIESNPGDTVLSRDVAYSVANIGYPGHAYGLFRKTSLIRPYEPQTYRDMARVLEKAGWTDLSLLYYEIGLIGKWPARFGDFKKILGLDYLRFLRQIKSGNLQTYVSDYAGIRLESIAKEYELGNPDLLVTITWNTDNTDVDLHVKEPTGETCYYSNRKTKIGGTITADVTQGFGPEMYLLKNAVNGTYKIKVKYYSSNQNRSNTRTKVSITVIQGWGTDNERITEKVVALEKNKEMHDIMTLTIEK